MLVAAVDGLSPLVSSLLIMVPSSSCRRWPYMSAYYAAAVIAFIELFLLGMFLGRIGRERLWFAGVKLVLAGVVALVISLLLNGGRP